MCMLGGGDGGAAAAAEESRRQAEADRVRREQQAAQEAEDARQREAERQARLETGRQNIEGAFSGFNDDFYKGIEQRNNDYYMPQLDTQYQKAYRTLVANLSRTGNLYSSAGLRQKGELADTLTQQQAAQGERARAAAAQARSGVEAARGDLNNQLLTSADPANVANVTTAAVNRANLLASPEPLSPLGDIFGSLIAQGANYLSPVATASRNGGGVTIFGGKKGGSVSYV